MLGWMHYSLDQNVSDLADDFADGVLLYVHVSSSVKYIFSIL